MGPMLPKPGTPAYEEFLRKARKPDSVEGRMMRQIVEDSTTQTQNQVRQMLMHMIEIVPGQLFRDIERFHKKFGLEPTKDHGHKLDPELLKFRIKFMLEELTEYCDAVGFSIDSDGDVLPDDWDMEKDQPLADRTFEAEGAFDALIDLVYVALGTAYLHRFPFNEGWDRVQEKNMQKVRAARPEDSKRGSGFDVVKPEGWTPPALWDLLDVVCPLCQGAGTVGNLETEPDDCRQCGGKGRIRNGTGAQNPDLA